MARTHEREIIKKLRDYLEKNFSNEVKVIGTNVGLWRFRQLKEALPDPAFLHPDIDILMTGTHDGAPPTITGIEAKAIYLRGDTKNLKFYQGLDEALALLRFGLDSVRLFQVFFIPYTVEEQMHHQMINAYVEYGLPVREIIRTLDLPIGYTAGYNLLINGQLLEDPIQVLDYKDRKKHFLEEQLVLPNRENPFLNSSLQYPKVIRKFLLDRFLLGDHGHASGGR